MSEIPSSKMNSQSNKSSGTDNDEVSKETSSESNIPDYEERGLPIVKEIERIEKEIEIWYDRHATFNYQQYYSNHPSSELVKDIVPSTKLSMLYAEKDSYIRDLRKMNNNSLPPCMERKKPNEPISVYPNLENKYKGVEFQPRGKLTNITEEEQIGFQSF